MCKVSFDFLGTLVFKLQQTRKILAASAKNSYRFYKKHY